MAKIAIKEKSELADVPFKITELPAEDCWDQLPDEPIESHAILLTLINEVPRKTVGALFNHLTANGRITMNLAEFGFCAEKYRWIERAYAYEAKISEMVKRNREKKLEQIQDGYDDLLLKLQEATLKLTTEPDAVKAVTDYGGLLAAAKSTLPNQISNMYKARVGDKVKMEVEGRFDHRIAVAVAEFAKGT